MNTDFSPKQHMTFHSPYLTDCVQCQINDTIKMNPEWKVVSVTPSFTKAKMDGGGTEIYVLWEHTGEAPVKFTEYGLSKRRDERKKTSQDIDNILDDYLQAPFKDGRVFSVSNDEGDYYAVIKAENLNVEKIQEVIKTELDYETVIVTDLFWDGNIPVVDVYLFSEDKGEIKEPFHLWPLNIY